MNLRLTPTLIALEPGPITLAILKLTDGITRYARCGQSRKIMRESPVHTIPMVPRAPITLLRATMAAFDQSHPVTHWDTISLSDLLSRPVAFADAQIHPHHVMLQCLSQVRFTK